MDDNNREVKATEAPPEPAAASDAIVEGRPIDTQPVLARITRPLAKGAIKGGLILYDKGKEAAADLRAKLGGLLTEARAELRERRGTPPREPAKGRPHGSARE